MASLYILLPLILSLMMIFPFLSHPLGMGLNLLITTILITSSMGVLNSNLWVTYVIILVLLGGLLVIFIYVSLLASNEVFIPTISVTLMMGFVAIISSILFLSLSSSEFPNTNENFQNLSSNYNENLEWLSHLYSVELSSITLFLIFYLLLTLIVVVFNTKNNHMSLRSFNK